MRTTIDLDDEAQRAVEEQRAATGEGLSAAVNALIRRGAVRPRTDYVFPRVEVDMRARLSLDRTAELLDLLDGEGHR